MVRVTEILDTFVSAGTQDAFNRMSEEERAFLQGLATALICILESAEKEMAAKVVEQRFDIDEHLALWSLLPAKVRTAIKRGGQ